MKKPLLCWCGLYCTFEPAITEQECITQDAFCPTHGRVYVVSTRLGALHTAVSRSALHVVTEGATGKLKRCQQKTAE